MSMSKQEIKNMIKNAVDQAVESRKRLAHDEKVLYIAATASGISAITLICTCAKTYAIKRRIKKCEKRIAKLEEAKETQAE